MGQFGGEIDEQRMNYSAIATSESDGSTIIPCRQRMLSSVRKSNRSAQWEYTKDIAGYAGRVHKWHRHRPGENLLGGR
ncbi:hypothetical protein [Rhizobium sp. Root1203]|uniref:hypothetical protein n=1 Tax=Rhizobium sp. Root1203 TaxID=1736427 RepID=UPI0012E347A9|nr:hypothetical protein [Rhizobium sp. Root1203]